MEIEQVLHDILLKQTEVLARLTRPYVIVDIYPRRSVNTLYFRIRNTGLTPAFNIRTKIDPPIPLRQRLSSELNIFSRPVGVLGPKEELSFFFDSAIELFSRENPIFQFDVGLEYSDADNATYQQTIHIDIELLKNLAIELPATDKIADELGRIQKELEKLARYTDRLLHQDMLKELRESQEQAEQPPKEESSS